MYNVYDISSDFLLYMKMEIVLNTNTILLFKREEDKNTKIFFGAFIDGKLEYIEDTGNDDGNIYAARVDKIVQNLDSAFVKFGQGRNGYLNGDEVYCLDDSSFDKEISKKIKCGQNIAVQIKNKKVKSKNVALTGKISLAGKYCVVTIGRRGIGASKKIPQQLQRKMVNDLRYELSHNFSQVDLTKFGILIRTESYNLNASPIDIARECASLSLEIEGIIQKGKSLTDGSIIYSKKPEVLMNEHLLNLVHFIEMLNSDPISIKAGDKDLYDAAIRTEIVSNKTFAVSDISFYNNKDYCIIYKLTAIFEEMYSQRVWLKSGGYLIIEKTEAFISIDVNSGKNLSHGRNVFLQTNIEAAREAMRQIRLRDLSGMILIDFINMDNEADNDALSKELEELCKIDPKRSNFVDITGLGIAEITRTKK